RAACNQLDEHPLTVRRAADAPPGRQHERLGAPVRAWKIACKHAYSDMFIPLPGKKTGALCIACPADDDGKQRRRILVAPVQTPPAKPFWRQASNTTTLTAFDRFMLRDPGSIG